MTKEEIIEMAMEAEFVSRGKSSEEESELFVCIDKDIYKLANLVAAKAIKEALAQPEQEPVAWGVFDDNLHDMFFAKEEAQEMVRLKGDGSTVKPLYTTPPQREFVGLTDEDVERIVRESRVGEHGIGYTIAKAIEAKLKEKNLREQE